MLSAIYLGGNLSLSPMNYAVGQVVRRLGWAVCARTEVRRWIWVHAGWADTALDRKLFFFPKRTCLCLLAVFLVLYLLYFSFVLRTSFGGREVGFVCISGGMIFILWAVVTVFGMFCRT